MERWTALILSLVLFLIFAALAYYGAKATLWASVVLALLLSLLILNFFYPVSQLATDDADASLVVYAIFFLLGILILFVYVVQSTLSTTRC